MATQDEIFAQIAQGPEARKSSRDLNYAEGALGTALWSAGPGMIGVDPRGSLADWQSENPVSSVVSGMAGMAVPYTGLFKASQAIKPWANFVERVAPAAKVARSPFMGGAAREAARWAPAEAALVLGGAVGGESVADMTGGQYRGTGDLAAGNALAWGLGSLAGGALGKLGSAGAAALKRRGVTPGADLSKLPQVQMRQVRERLAKGDVSPEQVEWAEGGINRLKRAVINEDPADGLFFRNNPDDPVSQAMNNMLRQGDVKGRSWRSRKISSFKGDDAEGVIKNLDAMPEDWEAFARFPRILNPRAAKSQERQAKNFQALQDEVKKNMPNVSKDGRYRWAATPTEDVFSMAKQFDDGRWMTFQTDNPGKFMPDEKNWADIIERESFKNFGDIDPNVNLAGVKSDILQHGREALRDLETEDFRGLRDEKKGLGAAFKRMGMEGRMQNSTEGLRRMGVFTRAYLAPADLQFAKNPIAHRIRRTVKEMIDHGELKTQQAIMGKVSNSGKNLLRETAAGPEFAQKGTIRARVQKLASNDPDQWKAFLQTIHSGEGIEYGIKNLGLNEDGVSLLRQINGIDKDLSDSIIAMQRASGIPEAELFKPKAGHFMLSRTWKGNWRTPVYNDKGKLVYVAGGESRKESLEMAQEIAKRNEWREPNARDALTTDQWGDMDMMRKVAINDTDYRTAMQQAARMVNGRKPGTFAKREGVGGFQMEYSPEEFLRSLVGHSRRYRNYEAELATNALFKKDMAKLAVDDREVAEQLSKRLDLMFGKEGEISKAVNKATDTILAPYMGNNSASRIMGTLNSGMYRYSLGFINTGYGIATLLTFAQTAFPMMSMINTLATQAPQRLGKYTSYKPIMSEGGATVMGMLDPMKIAGQAFKELGEADGVLAGNLRRAAAEGTTDPRFLDEFVGQNSVSKQKFAEVLQGDEPVVGFLKVLADTIPATTERFSRGHTFTMGHIFYRDVMGVKDPEKLFRLSKEFTDKTQYLYGTGDRAQLITGPIGSSFGLFKNWVMNYIGWMAAYAGEGFAYNNWKPLMMMMGGTAGVGGVGALPFVGTYNALSSALGGESAMHQIYEGFGGSEGADGGPGIADMIYYGLPMGLGISVQSTVQAPFHNPTEDAARFFQIATLSQGIKIGTALGTAWDTGLRQGRNPIVDPLVRQQLAGAFAPKSVHRAVSMAMDDTIYSTNNGNPLIGDLSPSERLLYGMSLNPRWVSTRFAFSREMWNKQAEYKKRLSNLGRDMAVAQAEGDRAMIRRISYAAVADNISMDSIMRSAAAQRSRDDEDIITSRFDERAQARLDQLGLL